VEDDRKRHVGTIRVLVADNSRFHTQLLAGVLSRDPDFQVVSSALDAASLVAASISQKTDLFVLSAFVDEDAQRGFRILQEIRETNPHACAVMLLDSSKPESVLEAFRAGARGVFDHQESSDMLCQCIRKVHAGQVWVNNEQVALVLDALAASPKVRAVGGNGMNLLSKREADVVRCLAEGLTNREIADRLGLSQHTIKNHLFRIFDKLGVSNRIELMFMTLSHGAAPPLLPDLQKDPPEGYDEATLALCEKAAEQGTLAAQLLLARISWTEKASDSDVIRAYMWYSVALDQLTRTKNNVKKAMNPIQLAEAERRVRELLNRLRRIEPSPTGEASSDYGRRIVA
jgi:two-component system nitrate/nitrite response regulator NarL